MTVSNRPLHAVLLPAAELLEPLAAALDGTGPAIAPLDPALPPARLRQLLGLLAPDALRRPDGSIEPLPAGPAPGIGDGTAVVIVTSGSTGTPKGVELSAAALRHSARASLDRIGARPGQRWLCCLPVSHIAGLQVLIRSLLADSTPVICDRLDRAVAEASEGLHVSLVPTQLRRLLSDGVDLAQPFRSILLGGAAAPARLLEEASQAGGRVVTTYGMSETCGGCVYDGMPLDGVRVRVGQGGLIQIAGAVLFSGYRSRPSGEAAETGESWFTTADLGSVGPDGRLAVRGRADDVINTGGEKVVAGEVAAALEACAAVRAAVVVGRPDPEWGERITAVVVPADPTQPPDLEFLRAHVRQTLPVSAAPRELVLVEEFPLLPSGKPDLRALREPGRNKRANREQ
jgi:O-succinylbenzoic acid--CoA ligase